MSLPGGDMRPSVISSIFGAVGRELQQFVLSAAGISPVCALSGLLPSHAMLKPDSDNRTSSISPKRIEKDQVKAKGASRPTGG